MLTKNFGDIKYIDLVFKKIHVDLQCYTWIQHKLNSLKTFFFYAALAQSIVDQIVPEGRDTILRCNSNSETKWSRPEYWLPEKVQIINNSILIPQVTLEDEGIYICTTKNDKEEELHYETNLIVAGR